MDAMSANTNRNSEKFLPVQKFLKEKYGDDVCLGVLQKNFYRPVKANKKKELEECFAKLILEEKIPERYRDLDYNKERPDLRNESDSVGIEVTSDVYEKEREIMSLHEKYKSKQSEKVEKRLRSLGAVIDNGACFCPTASINCSTVISRIENKLQKLRQDGFNKYSKNALFIKRDVGLLEEEKGYLRENAMMDKNDVSFDYVYIYINGRELIELDLRPGGINKFDSDYMETFVFSQSARYLLFKQPL